MVDKNYCMSAYCVFRNIPKDDMEFADGLHHAKDICYPEEKKVAVTTADDIARAYRKAFEEMRDVKLGIMLSGGMDSACLAAFMKPDTDAYTFRFLGGKFRQDDLHRAEQFANKYQLHLHYVDVDWSVVEKNVDILMKRKGEPVHPIEPQVYETAIQAKEDGVEMMVAADGSDLVFGGMDLMLSKDWEYDEWIEFFTFLDPFKVLKEPVSMDHIFAPYKLDDNKIDYMTFMEEVFAHESNGVFCNAFIAAEMKYTPYYDPSGMVKMAEPLDLNRVRNGESKYLIRELFKKCYPEFPIPEKVPMPRPVDYYFENWKGPKRPEFREDINLDEYTGNQKWQMWCLERFLDMLERRG
ncbi:MAG: asparagine synthase [Lachnospiraceae bacterium]|nr:asparagine synthase [Lachnospiraceae bacterium]